MHPIDFVTTQLWSHYPLSRLSHMLDTPLIAVSPAKEAVAQEPTKYSLPELTPISDLLVLLLVSLYLFPLVLHVSLWLCGSGPCEGKVLCSKSFLCHVEVGGVCFLRRLLTIIHLCLIQCRAKQVGRLEINWATRERQQKNKPLYLFLKR